MGALSMSAIEEDESPESDSAIGDIIGRYRPEFDSVVEDSIRRCEALLAMTPVTLQDWGDVPSYSKANVARTYLDLDLEAKMKELEPDRITTTILLNNMPKVDERSSFSTSSQQSDDINNITSSQECGNEVESNTLSLPQSHGTYSSNLMRSRSPQDKFKDHQTGHIKRRSRRGRRFILVEDWNYYNPSVGMRKSPAFEDERHLLEHFEDVTNTTSLFNESDKSFYCTMELSPKKDFENQGTTSRTSEDESQSENATHIGPPVPSEEAGCDNLFQAISTSQHFEEAWDWDEKRPTDSPPGSNCEGDFRHEACSQKEIIVEKSLSSWRPETIESERTQPSGLQPVKDVAGLRPKGLPSNYRRIKTVGEEKWKVPESESTKTESLKPGKLKMQTVASQMRLAESRFPKHQSLSQARASQEAKGISEFPFRIEPHKNISQVRAQETKGSGLTFKLETNQKSARIPRQRARSAPTSPRNHLMKFKESQLLIPSQSKQANILRAKCVCTFAPEINPNTNKILVGSSLDGCNFLSCQERSSDKAERCKRLKELEFVDLTFQPQTGNAAFILSHSPMADLNNENLVERCDRLSNKDSQHREYIRRLISDNYYAQFAFQPQIDETSRIVGRTPTFQSLYVNEGGKQHKEELELKAQEEFQKMYTFRPAVRPHTPSRDIEDILEHYQKTQQEKTKDQDLEQAERESKELSECTFKPLTHPLPPKEMKKPHDLPRRQYTIPKPFTLHTLRPKIRGCPHCSSGAPCSFSSPQSQPGTPNHSHQPCS